MPQVPKATRSHFIADVWRIVPMFMKHMWHLETLPITAPFHIKPDYSMVTIVTDHLHSEHPGWSLHNTTYCKDDIFIKQMRTAWYNKWRIIIYRECTKINKRLQLCLYNAESHTMCTHVVWFVFATVEFLVDWCAYLCDRHWEYVQLSRCQWSNPAW